MRGRALARRTDIVRQRFGDVGVFGSEGGREGGRVPLLLNLAAIGWTCV